MRFSMMLGSIFGWANWWAWNFSFLYSLPMSLAFFTMQHVSARAIWIALFVALMSFGRVIGFGSEDCFLAIDESFRFSFVYDTIDLRILL